MTTGTAPRLQHVYEPWGGCLEVFKCRAPELLISGPAGTGKSRACLEKLHLAAMMNPGMKGLIVRKTQVSMTSTALVTYREHVAAEAIAAGVCWFYGGSREKPAAYYYENGSVIVLGGMDMPTKVMSSEYDMIYVQEAIELTVTDWESLVTRLRNGVLSFQQLLADTNPDSPVHWLKQRCDEGKTVFIESRHEDNPVLCQRDGSYTSRGRAYLNLLDGLTGTRYYRLRKGLWVAAEGIIYEEYDPAVHLIDRFDIPDSWARWWSVDFGYTNPFVLQCWAEDPDGRLYRYREIYMTQRLVAEHGKQMLDIVAPRIDPNDEADQPARHPWIEPRPRAIICDHDADGRATLSKAVGQRTTAAVKTVTEGIQKVQQRLKPAGDGRPRLFLLRDSLVELDQALAEAKRPTCTEDEIAGYVWAAPKAKPGTAKVKEEPVKEGDHGQDAKRYMVAYRDLSVRPSIRMLKR